MPIRFCSKSSLKISDDINVRKAEMESVNARVTKTKLEIEELKNQLQELINDGIRKSDFSKTKENVAALKSVTEAQPPSKTEVIKAKTFKDSITDIIGSVNEENEGRLKILSQSFVQDAVNMEATPRKVLKTSNLQTTKADSTGDVQGSPKKVRHYDREAARKYIEKQRQRRRELTAQKKASVVLQDMKKQRLEELHRKSIELVSKSIKAKKKQPVLNESNAQLVPEQCLHLEKSNSHNLIAQEPIANLPSNLLNDMDAKREHKLPASQKTFSNSDFKNITVRSPQNNDSRAILLKNMPKLRRTNEDETKAAIKIQAVYRGYRQRKNFEMNRKRNLETERAKLYSTKEVQTSKAQKSTPNWLQGPSMPSSYNFITAVKHKLNLAVQQISSYKDEATSFRSQHAQTSNDKESFAESEKLKSFLSHKCLSVDKKDVQPLKLASNVQSLKLNVLQDEASVHKKKHGVNSDSDTSNNIPEISSEGTLTLLKNTNTGSTKRPHSDADDKLSIDTEKIKKLKLRSSQLLADENEAQREADSLKYSGRDSIIAYNKCDYVESEPTEVNHASRSTSHSKLNLASSDNFTQVSSEQTHQDVMNSFHSKLKKLSLESKLRSTKKPIETESRLTDKPQSEIKSDGIETASKFVDKQKSSVKSDSIESANNSKDARKSKITSNDAVSQPEYSSNFTSEVATSPLPSIKVPTMSLRSSLVSLDDADHVEAVRHNNITNLNLRVGEKAQVDTKMQSNEIHLKFEAELHLLNDFNDSLRQFMEVEKSLVDLRASKNPNTKETKYYTRDTQTSILTTKLGDIKVTSDENSSEKHIPTINYSRGSEASDQIDIFGTSNSNLGLNDTSLLGTSLDLSNVKDSFLTTSREQSNIISIKRDKVKGEKEIPLEMFDQLILDEDIRIENLKTILKIREKALVDRTKGELAWLEIQKKNLRDSGQLQQISTIKKKQRGLLIKLEHERHEMQRLKQLQKAASKKRKLALTDKRNMIKSQLSTNNVITKIKRSTREEKRHVGPLKVYNIKSHSESVKSETSISRRSSITEEVLSVVSQSRSVVSYVTEEENLVATKLPQQQDLVPAMFLTSQVEAEDVKRSLLMREEALQKRRKAAEELLQWHQRLIDEEKKITELELAANAILNPTLATDSEKQRDEKYKFKGFQLNLLWKNMTGREENKFDDKLTYSMSKISLEQFCKDAKKLVNSRNKGLNKKSETNSYVDELKENSVVNSARQDKYGSAKGLGRVETNRDVTDYTSDFDSTFSEEQTQSKASWITDRTSEPDNKFHITDDVTADIIDEKSSSSERKVSSKSEEQNMETEIGSNENLISGEIETEKHNSQLEVNTEKEETAVISEHEEIGSGNDKTVSPNSIRTEMSSKLNLGQDQSEILSEYATTDLVSFKLASAGSENSADEESTNLEQLNGEKVSENQTSYKEMSKPSQNEVTENSVSHLELKTDLESSVIASERFSNASNQAESEKSAIVSEYESNHDVSSKQKSPSSHVEIDTQGSELSINKNKSLARENEIYTENKNSSSILSVDKANSELRTNDGSSSKTQFYDESENQKSKSEAKIEESLSEITSEDQKSESKAEVEEHQSEITSEDQKSESKAEIEEHRSEITSEDQKSESKAEIEEHRSEITSEDQKSKAKIDENQSEIINENQKSETKMDEDQSEIASELHSNYEISSKLQSHDNEKLSNLEIEQSIIVSEYEVNDEASNHYEEEIHSEKRSSKSSASNKQSEIPSENQSNSGVLTNDHSLNVKVTEQEGEELYSEKPSLVTTGSKKHTLITSEHLTLGEENISELQSLAPNENSELIFHVSVDHESRNDHSNIPTHKEASQSFQIGSGDGISIKSKKEIENLNLRSQIGSGDGLNPSLRDRESEILSEYDTENDVSEELLSEKLQDVQSDADEPSEIRDSVKLDKSPNEWETKSESTVSERSHSGQFEMEENEDEVPVPEIPKNVINKSVIMPPEDERNLSEDLGTSSNDSKDDSSLHDIESLDKSDPGNLSDSKKSEGAEVENVNLELETEKSDADELDTIYPVHKNSFDVEISSEEVTDSENPKSPLQLSYGYIEKKPQKSGDSTTADNSSDDSKNFGENTSLRLEDKSDSEPNFKDNKSPVLCVDVKKRVSEIMADANSPRGDRSPRMQDLYVTAYDIISPERSPEPDSPVDDVEPTFSSPKRVYENDEVEELLKKQLAIEQEIKAIQQQQQKEHLPYLYVREIPNKPPPPYKPPVISQVPSSSSILPSSDNYINVITSMASDLLYNAYLNNKFETITLSDEQKSLLQTKHKIEESCYEFVFDLCKEAALLHHKQFEHKSGPSWMYITKKSKLAINKSIDKVSFEKFIDKNVKQWLGYEITKTVENTKNKWSSKKRDHVDELLVAECQTEESEWTNYDSDEIIVKDELTKNIMDMLIEESAQLFNDILTKNKSSSF